jgi:hypothetical protein
MINLTQHTATLEQGCVEPFDKAKVMELLTFGLKDIHPSQIWERASELAKIAKESGETAAMIGGAPYLMGPLETALRANGITPLYAFSIRESAEELQPDGSIKKTNVFRHAGFVEGAL